MIFQYGELPVHYIDEGEGIPILLLHGWMGNGDSFLPLRRGLRNAHCRLIAPDFPGQGGQTCEPPVPCDVYEHANIVRALMKELGIERVSIVAHSFGGRVSLKLAAESPELVDKMVLTGCAGLKPRKTLKRRARGMAYRAARAFVEGPLAKVEALDQERLREALISRFGSADYKALSPSLRQTFNLVVAEDLSYCLPKISAPTVLVYGTDDRETPVWMGEKVAREIPDAALIPFEGAGHFAYLEWHGKFLAIVQNFLLPEDG